MNEIPPKNKKMTKAPPMPEKGGKPLDYLNNTRGGKITQIYLPTQTRQLK